MDHRTIPTKPQQSQENTADNLSLFQLRYFYVVCLSDNAF